MPITLEEAQSAIGEQPDCDYNLDLDAHLTEYSAKAPLLGELLRTAPVKVHRDAYKEFDLRALASQSSYKRWVTTANRAVLASAVCGGGVMAVKILEAELPSLPFVSWALLPGAAATLAGLIAIGAMTRVREGKLLESWMGRRAQAETQRLAYFAAVASEAAARSKDYQLLALEYVRRYQLDLQKIYYQCRGRRHEESANKTLGWAMGAAVLAATPAVVAWAGDWGAALAIFGVIGGALAAYATVREGVHQDRRNAERYERTWGLLNAVTGKLDEVRAAVESGSQDALRSFTDAVNEQISLEHRQFLEGAEGAAAAIGRLDAALKPLPAGRPAAPDPNAPQQAG